MLFAKKYNWSQDWDEPQVKMESELLFKEEPRPEEDEKELIPLALFRKKKGSRKSGKQSQVKEVIMYTLTTSSY